MTLVWTDWAVIVAYFALSLAIGFAYSRRAGRSLADYFVTGRSLPWWLAGTSMVATTFAADTPLAVAGLVAKYGVAGNWLWWCYAFSGILTVFFFARLWRRSGVMTDVEFTELRYAGRPAAALRAFRAVYLALPINLIILGWVTRAMVTILQITLDVDPWQAAIGLFLVTAVYSAASGLWGVIVTDAVQFVVAMAGSIILAVLAVRSVGGLDALVAQASAHFGSRDAALAMLPPLDSAWLPLPTLLAFFTLQWWATSYPGAEPGGGSYVAQRILSAKDERHGLLATLWFNIAHYAVRPWPWILVGLVAVLTHPGLAKPEEGYVIVMVDVLPSPLRGLLLAAFAAAYMSTVSTHLNWGSSYLVNDIYLRFVRPGATERQRVRASRLATGLTMLLALGVMQVLSSVEQGWKLFISLGAGTGLVLILRWYWWRVNAWSEIAAMAASFVTTIALQASGLASDDTASSAFARGMLVTVGVTTLAWLAVTFLTPPEPPETLERFYRRVRPGGPGWRAVAARLGFAGDRIPGGAASWANWAAGVVAVYATVFMMGEWLTGTPLRAVVAVAAAAAAFALIARNLARDKELHRVDTPPGDS